MTSRIKFETSSTELLRVRVVSRGDPTATAPSFEITPESSTDPSESWLDGQWTTEWDSVDGVIWALTPLIGKNATAPFQLTEGVVVKLWSRWLHGTDDVKRVAAIITPI